MAVNKYQYTTSPKKIEQEYERTSKKHKKHKLKVVEDVKRQDIQVSNEQKKQQKKITLLIIMIFAILLVISYRNSLINESFSEVQDLKKELSLVEKENEQLKVSIENSLNLSHIEQVAKEKLGMQKLSNKDTVYINLPKKDYTESASEKVIKKEEKWYEKIVKYIQKNFNNE